MTESRMDLYVGCDVVCVDDKFAGVTIPQGIEEGRVYKIRWLGMFNNYVDGEFLGVRLVGVERGVDPTYGYDDPPFAARRFRPLVRDPIALFKRIAADPHGYKVTGPEGPVRVPDGPLPVKEREREVV